MLWCKRLPLVCVLMFAVAALLPGISLAQSRVVLVATGSSLPEPLYLKWNDEFHKQNDGVMIRYLPLGTLRMTRHGAAAEAFSARRAMMGRFALH